MDAAVSAGTGAMGSVAGKLLTLLGEEYKLKGKVKRGVASLELDLRSMNALLEQLAQKEEALDPLTKAWRDQVREEAYDIEDFIDVYMYRRQRQAAGGRGIRDFIRGKIGKLQELVHAHGFSDRISELKRRMTETDERRKRLQLPIDAAAASAGVTKKPVDPRARAIFQEAESLVGIDGPREELVDRIMVHDGDPLSDLMKVVSIVGLGGSGKTTLANQVYRRLQGDFVYRAFISVSRTPDLTKIFKDIYLKMRKQELDDMKSWDEPRLVEELRKYYGCTLPESSVHDRTEILKDLFKIKEKECGDINSWDQQRLIKELTGFLKDKRYFVVIDDIWDIDAWKDIRCALPDCNCGSRILTTTRIINVAKKCCLNIQDYVHNIIPLNKADSESLFFKRTFKPGEVCPPQLKDVSIEIVRRCAGLPLAIITMASLLSNRPSSTYTKEQWMAVRDSIGLGLLRDPSVEEMNMVLSLSYVDLPGHLKTCLLYLSIFPEDYVIRRGRLIKRWIAEGFIKSAGGLNLETEGENYFNELINRSIIQPVGIKYNGRVKACRVHDVILDLIKVKAKEVNFATLINQMDRETPQYTVRRLSLDYRDQEYTTVSSMDRFFQDESSMAGTRSLTIFQSIFEQISLVLNFRALRVLDIEGCLTKDGLMNIGKLILLRYLRLSSTRIKELPEEVGRLKFLETLDIKLTSIEELPANICQLPELKHLRVHDVKLPAGIGNMRSLETVSQLLVDDSCPVTLLQELGNLTSLRSLVLLWKVNAGKKRYTDNLMSSLSKIGRSNLRFLRVHTEFWPISGLFAAGSNPNTHEFAFDSCLPPPECLEELTFFPKCYLCKIPMWMASLASLTYAKVGINPVEQEALDIFGRLPSLLFLELCSNKIVSGGLKISRGMFQCLKEFGLYCYDIETGLLFEDGAMQNIERLAIPFRAHRAESTATSGILDIANTIHHLSTLQHLYVRISCKGADEAGVMALEAGITNVASQHPTANFRRYYTDDMVNDPRTLGVHQANLSTTDSHHRPYHALSVPEDMESKGPDPYFVHSAEVEPNSCTIL